MRNLLFAKAIYFLSLTAMATSASPTFLGQDGGGGAALSAEFATTGRKAIEILSIGDSSLNYQEILNKIKTTKALPANNLCFNFPNSEKTYCEDAHYYPDENLILFDVDRWDNGLACREKLMLASHEFLRASEVEGEDYLYSGRFLIADYVICEDDSPEGQAECSARVVYLSRVARKLCDVLQGQKLERSTRKSQSQAKGDIND